jgi:Xaa-Pro aminopeptidase
MSISKRGFLKASGASLIERLASSQAGGREKSRAGMSLSNEPGICIPESFGVR